MSESDIYRPAAGTAGTSGYPSTTAQDAQHLGKPQASSASATSTSSSTASAVTSSVKDATSDVAGHAGEAGKDLAQEARARAGDVAHEARDRASSLLHQARSEVTEQASTQQQRLASGLRTMGSELTQMSGAAQDPGYATDLVRQASGMADRLAGWFEDREPGDVMREAKDFAQRRPGAFLAIAAGAGLLAGRMLRGVRDAGEGGSAGTGTGPTSSPAHLRTDAAPARTSVLPAGPGGAAPGGYGQTEPDPFASPASSGLSSPGTTPGTTTYGTTTEGTSNPGPAEGTTSGVFPPTTTERGSGHVSGS